MTLREIPTLTDGTQVYEQRTRLDGVDYLFGFVWSARRERWTFSMQSLDGADIITGQTVVTRAALLNRAVAGPPGQIVAVPENDSNNEPPGFLELGGRVKLIYITEDELEGG